MVLVIDGVVQDEHPPDSRTFFLQCPLLLERNKQFLSRQSQKVDSGHLIYVQQREMAITASNEKHVMILGSDDATTCIIIILRHSGSGAVGMAHLDGSCTDECITDMIVKILDFSVGVQGRLELYLVGGFSDVNNFSEDLFVAIMRALQSQNFEIDVKLACVGQYNTTVRNNKPCPYFYGAGVDLRNGDIFPATFTDKGPDRVLRIVRRMTKGQEVIDIYDARSGLLKIGPFNYEPLRNVDLWLEQSDEIILQYWSTTPDVEPPHFVPDFRAALQYIRDNPFPAVTVSPDNEPHYFRMDDVTGLWVPSNRDT